MANFSSYIKYSRQRKILTKSSKFNTSFSNSPVFQPKPYALVNWVYILLFILCIVLLLLLFLTLNDDSSTTDILCTMGKLTHVNPILINYLSLTRMSNIF